MDRMVTIRNGAGKEVEVPYGSFLKFQNTIYADWQALVEEEPQPEPKGKEPKEEQIEQLPDRDYWKYTRAQLIAELKGRGLKHQTTMNKASLTKLLTEDDQSK